MSLRDVVVSAVAIANKVTKPLQGLVSHQSFVSASGDGTLIYAGPVLRRALIDWKQQAVRTKEGQEVTSRAKVTFLEPVTVDEQDIIILPDGTTGPILDISGFVDAVTGNAYFPEVWLG